MKKMFRATDMLLIAAMVAAAGFTYKTKHDAENQLEALQKIERQIRYEEDSIDVLKADWSMLTQPSRLQRLSEVFAGDLDLKPVEPTQIVGLEALPGKPMTIDDILSDMPAGLLVESILPKDKIKTGAVKKP